MLFTLELTWMVSIRLSGMFTRSTNPWIRSIDTTVHSSSVWNSSTFVSRHYSCRTRHALTVWCRLPTPTSDYMSATLWDVITLSHPMILRELFCLKLAMAISPSHRFDKRGLSSLVAILIFCIKAFFIDVFGSCVDGEFDA